MRIFFTLVHSTRPNHIFVDVIIQITLHEKYELSSPQ
jgi:hypothetical protein